MERRTLPPRVGLALSVGAAAIGLVASSALAVDYTRSAPIFCSEGGGCAALRGTPVATPLGVPLPIVGLVGFLAVGGVALLAGRRARVAQVALASVGALVGASLLVAQGLLGHLCPYCVFADVSGVAGAAIAVSRLVWERGEPPRATWVGVAGSALVAAGCAPLVVGVIRTASGGGASAVPAVIHAEMDRTPRGKVTVVDFVDFECPFCRSTNAELAPLLEAHENRIRLVRRQVPLRSHPHALDAARAACCGERLGRGDDMASALFAAPVDDLTPQGCEKIATTLGLALAPFRACVADPGTDASIESDRAEFKAAGGQALPTLWIGDTEIVGTQPSAVLVGVLHAAIQRVGG